MDMMRNYYELQERDLENTEDPNLPLTFSEQFLWNRDFQLRWDLTKNLHMSFQSATHAEIEEPYTPINKDLYADRYDAWKDSVWQSISHWGTPLDYQQTFNASYQLPLDKLPIFDWVKLDGKYDATYSWLRGTELDDGTSLGNTIQNNRNLTLNGNFNLETLYNHIPFLKKANEESKKQQQKPASKPKTTPAKPGAKEGEGALKGNEKDDKPLPKNKNTFQKEVTLVPDSVVEIQHGKKTKRILFSARNKDGKVVDVKWKVVDENKIKVWIKSDKKSADDDRNAEASLALESADSLGTVTPDSINIAKADSLAVPDSDSGKEKPAIGRIRPRTPSQPQPQLQPKNDVAGITVKISVTPKEPLENQWWYKPAQQTARFLMMVRSVNFSYRNQRSMALPGFMPGIGDMFGQRTGDILSPGLDFAFGLNGDDYVDKALERGWLLCNDSVATPSSSQTTEDFQLRATVEPVRDLKIELSATRTQNRAKSVQFMYAGMPTTQSGTFTMTTISLGSALEGMGDANDGYHSPTFDKFCAAIPEFRDRVQAQYPASSTNQASPIGQPNANPVDPYSADVLVPAFLSTYTTGAGKSLDIFPALSRLLPNWTVRYSGLSKIPFFANTFKSVNLNHSYKSVYSVGSYASFSSWLEYMGDLGYVQTADGSYTPSSPFNISTVSINEAFSPLGLEVTLKNNMTLKLEYKTTRVLNLSMTSVQLNESRSKDWVIGTAYKITNFNIFGSGTSHRKVKGNKKGNNKEDDDKSGGRTQSNNNRGGVNHDLNMRLDISFRKQAAITRDIATGVSSASSGNSALKISFAADYTLSRFLTLTAYYDRQTNTPLLSSSSYPTTTQDFGLSMKFSLTR